MNHNECGGGMGIRSLLRLTLMLTLFGFFFAKAATTTRLLRPTSSDQALAHLSQWLPSGRYISSNECHLEVQWLRTENGKSFFIRNLNNQDSLPRLLLPAPGVSVHPESEIIEASLHSQPTGQQLRIHQIYRGQIERYLSVQKTTDQVHIILRNGPLWDTTAPRILCEDLRSEGDIHPSRTIEHSLPLTVYNLRTQHLDLEQLVQRINRTNNVLKACQLEVHLHNIVHPKVPRWLGRWESLEFNNYRISKHEEHFFQKVAASQYGIILVDEIDWSQGYEGTRAVGYGRYIVERHLLTSPAEEQFLSQRMAGYLVLSPWLRKWTLAHEVGHAILNLSHDEDPKNLMFPSTKISRPKLRPEQCARFAAQKI